MKRTAEEAARTRIALLQAALMAFEEKGWRGATFEHVAERAGVTRGAVHHHFRSKSRLLNDALEWGWAEYGARVFDQSASASKVDEQLSTLLAEYVTLLHDDELFRALASTTVLVAPQTDGDTTSKHVALETWRDEIATMVDSHVTTLSASTIADLILVLLQGFTVTAVTRPIDLLHPDELGTATAALVKGVLT